ncbi:unnamed protein product, partial [Closterium sp. NIES-54]
SPAVRDTKLHAPCPCDAALHPVPVLTRSSLHYIAYPLLHTRCSCPTCAPSCTLCVL